MDRQTVMRQKSTRLFVCAFVVMAPVHRACFLVFLLCQEDKEMYDSCILLRIPLTTHFLSSIPLINSWRKHSRHNWVIFQSCKIMVDSTVVGSNPNVSNISKSSNHTHYSKSQIFLQKFNFDKTPTFSRVFHSNFFLTIFLVKSKLSTAKKSKTTTFSQVFHPKKVDSFLEKSKLNFWTKNEDFE